MRTFSFPQDMEVRLQKTQRLLLTGIVGEGTKKIAIARSDTI
ncbi:hypothetical protein QT971_17245 [Microcoleus sp. herbarium19]